VELDCQRLVSDDGRQRLLFFTAASGSHAAGQLELLAEEQPLEPSGHAV